MKVHSPIGSKERLFEMMQGVVREEIAPTLNHVFEALEKLQAGALKNEQGGSVEAKMQEENGVTFVGIDGNDADGNKYRFNFKITGTEGDQDGVVNVGGGDVVLLKFSFQSPSGEVINLEGNDLDVVNQKTGPELFDTVNQYIDIDVKAQGGEEEITEEDWIEKKEESDPFGGARKEFQDGMGYGDEKPVNPKLRVDAPELKKFVESTDQDKYENVVFMQGEEASEALNILMNQGKEEALEHLKQWHNPGQHMGQEDIGAGSGDFTFEKDGYTMSWNPYIGYIGLVYDMSQMNEGDGEAEIKKNYTSLSGDLDFSKMATAYEGLLKLKHSEFRASNSVQNTLSSLRDTITNYLKDVRGLNVTEEDVQNYFTNMLSKYSSVTEGEEEEVAAVEVPSFDPQDADQDGDMISGGKADDADVGGYDPDQIMKGMEVEMEHTDDPKVALEIAMDHLEEFSDYYSRLDKMEKDAEAELDGGQVSGQDGGQVTPEPSVGSMEEIPIEEPEASEDIIIAPEEAPIEEPVADVQVCDPEYTDHQAGIEDAEKELEDTLLGFKTNTPNADK